jgi:hypothetical protein
MGCGKIEQASKSFQVIVRLQKLIVDRCIRDGCFVENRVEHRVAELGMPIES